ncbi:MAG TPA: cytochrome B [Gammaproteobacteria bacterium]|nr:cytochrome B [Gammaproteobacteria bacterium]
MNGEIRVWDPLLRIFHWSLVLAFSVAWLTGDEESRIHIWSGYTVLGLISFRVVWGLLGSRHARFTDFLRGPAAVGQYLRSLAGGRPQHYEGHNPAGGWMVLAMLFTLFVVTLSGLEVYAIEEGRGPFAGSTDTTPVTLAWIPTARADDDEDEGESGEDETAWEEIHEASANFMLILVFLHITGVLVSSRLHGENLVRAMITGRKPRHDTR